MATQTITIEVDGIPGLDEDDVTLIARADAVGDFDSMSLDVIANTGGWSYLLTGEYDDVTGTRPDGRFWIMLGTSKNIVTIEADIDEYVQGSPVAVGSLTQAALAQFATDDTGETEAAAGSVAKLGQGDASGDPVIVPVLGVVQERVEETRIEVFTKETLTVSIGVVDVNGNAVDVSAMTLVIIVERPDKSDKTTIEDADITKATSTISFDVPAALSNAPGRYTWALRNTADNERLLSGPFVVTYAPQVDA